MKTDAIQEDVSTALNVSEAAEKILAMDAPEPSDEAESTEEDEVAEEDEEEETEEETEESETEETEEAEEPEEADQVEGEEIASYRADMTENLKEGVEHYDHIKVPIKVNGVEGEATITELVRDYQKNVNLGQKTDSLASDRAVLDKEISEKRVEYSNALSSAAGLVNQLEQQLVQSSENIDWNELRESDPAEFAAKKQELQEKGQQYQNAKVQIEAEHKKKLTEHFDSLIQRESAALMDSFPDWTDAKVAKTEKSDIREYLLSEGFTQAEVDGQVDANGTIVSAGMVDHRAIKLAKKAMMFDKGVKKVEIAKKRVKKLPKVARPGKPVPKSVKTSARSKALKGRLKKSGRVEDAAALIMDNLFGGS